MSGDSRGRPLLNVRCGVCRDWLYEIDGEGATMCIPCRRAYEAGRLAAARADVAYAAEHFERRADEWREHERRATGPLAKGCAAKVEEFAGQAADCRRWLEVTQ